MAILPDLTAIARPDLDRLLQLVSTHINDQMLAEIAEADYGQEHQEHLAQLEKIRSAGLSPVPMEWVPGEVLELIRWSEPDDPTHKPGGQGIRGHWMRAFACAALLRAAADVENRDLREGWNQTAIQLIDSLGAVGSVFYEPACALLVCLIARFDSDDETEELAFLGVGLLWLALHLRPTVPDGTIILLSNWIVAREQREKENFGEDRTDEWLLGSTFFNQCHPAWRRLGNRMQKLDKSRRTRGARKKIDFIANSLAGPS